MPKIVCVIPHSHTWFWTQICVASLVKNPPIAKGYDCQVVVVDNSPWSPAIKGIKKTNVWKGLDITVIENYKPNKYHASALDCVVENFDFDLFMALETDVMFLSPSWLQWFVDQLKESDYGVGHWHHESFVNPSCTLYRGSTLIEMNRWCKGSHYFGNDKDHVIPPIPYDEIRWGENFSKFAPLDPNIHLMVGHPAWAETMEKVIKGLLDWMAGPFAEKRGFAEGTILKEMPSGQLKGPGHYEPGQQLHHWATQAGYTYTICNTVSANRVDGSPIQTLYGDNIQVPNRQLEANEMFDKAMTVHLWGGTRALDILKHEVDDNSIKSYVPMWLAREARFWKQVVPQEIQERTLNLIRKYGFHITGQGSDHVTDRDKAAAEYVKQCYKEGGVEI